MFEHWYSVISAGGPVTQGDLVLDCPLIRWKDPAQSFGSSESETEQLQRSAEAFLADAIVMTQACDLEHSKVRNVVVCPHLSLSEYKDLWECELKKHGNNPTAKGWRSHCDDISDGLVWNLALLNCLTEGPITTEHRIVDFHEVYTVPREFLETLLQHRSVPRLRLLPPYREHLSQAFARFFMRVGLPSSIVKQW